MPIFLQKVIQISQCLLDRYTKTIIIYQEYQNPFPIGSLQSTQTLDRKPTQPTVHTHTNQKNKTDKYRIPKSEKLEFPAETGAHGVRVFGHPHVIPVEVAPVAELHERDEVHEGAHGLEHGHLVRVRVHRLVPPHRRGFCTIRGGSRRRRVHAASDCRFSCRRVWSKCDGSRSLFDVCGSIGFLNFCALICFRKMLQQRHVFFFEYFFNYEYFC